MVKSVQKSCPTQRANTKPNSRHNAQNGAFCEGAVSFLKCPDFQKQKLSQKCKILSLLVWKIPSTCPSPFKMVIPVKGKKNVENTKHINITLQNSKFYTLVKLMQTSVLLSL